MIRVREQIPYRAHPAALPSGALNAASDRFRHDTTVLADIDVGGLELDVDDLHTAVSDLLQHLSFDR
jgi:hypothetical protein